jgi:hypothetical protein
VAKTIIDGLLHANFILEINYTEWLFNMVLAKKSNGKWRMCVDYTNLKLKPAPRAYVTVTKHWKASRLLCRVKISLLHGRIYSGNNQISMFEGNKDKITFMTDQANFRYYVMSFGLRNAGATTSEWWTKCSRKK